jgi:hypothetical protein
MAAGEMFVVRRGAQHKPYAENEVKLLLMEPRGELNTGDDRSQAFYDEVQVGTIVRFDGGVIRRPNWSNHTFRSGQA